MKASLTALAAATLLALTACSGGGDTSPPPSPAPSAGGSTSAATAATGELSCTVSEDGRYFDVVVTNEGTEPVSFGGEAAVFAGGAEVYRTDVAIRAVQPGEVVRETFNTSLTEENPGDSCSVEAVVPEATPASVGADDVSGCENAHAGAFDSYAYELNVTNSSTEVPATYTMAVALRDPEGVRRETRLVLAANDNGAWSAVQPGDAVTQPDEALISTYDPAWTCEVVLVEKQTEGDFFTYEDGVATGSIDADIAFATGSADLTEDARVLLQTAIEALRTESGPVCVAGYADSVGDDADNLALSEDRAKSVADYLREAGVTAELQTVGRGESEATADNVDDPTLRRVDITLEACS